MRIVSTTSKQEKENSRAFSDYIFKHISGTTGLTKVHTMFDMIQTVQ